MSEERLKYGVLTNKKRYESNATEPEVLRSAQNGWEDGSSPEHIEMDGSPSDSHLHVSRDKSVQAAVRAGAKTFDRNEQGQEKEKVLKLSSAQLRELTASSPGPMDASFEDYRETAYQADNHTPKIRDRWTISEPHGRPTVSVSIERARDRTLSTNAVRTPVSRRNDISLDSSLPFGKHPEDSTRPYSNVSAISTPPLRKRLSACGMNGSAKSNESSTKSSKFVPPSLKLKDPSTGKGIVEAPQPSPMPSSIPVPPLSLPTYLQLELSSERPSPLYIHRSCASDFPYESSRVKIDRLLNFLLLPPQLEQVLLFGTLACLDAWLYSFTILPLRFLKATSIMSRSIFRNIATEMHFIGSFIIAGTQRIWLRTQLRRGLNIPIPPNPGEDNPFIGVHNGEYAAPESALCEGIDGLPEANVNPRKIFDERHRKLKTVPSDMDPSHKADFLKGCLILSSCIILMWFDASRMYHGIRGQAAIKLYVIYNVLEVCDRLFSALGQDILECLFSRETLERKPDGRSKVWRPLWLFILALCYNLVHSTALFYQVITLNVAINSYSNALLTLLMSNQFVEIKSSVFKKFEKENLFQITCADVVERFQLWLMLMIIASRNIIETGGLSAASAPGGPIILPKDFASLPEWTSQILGPFFLVLGSETLVDWIKHAYITKFNMTKPAIYGRFLDILAKDYYSNAFADPNLMRRLGLPIIPLACLFIRASVQTYHMFLATHIPPPIPSSVTSLTTESATESPATTAALQHIDQIFRRALGGSTFGAGGSASSFSSWFHWNMDDIIAFVTMLVFFLVFFLALLALKLVLGMCLLSFARRRYKGMKEKEQQSFHADGKRSGGWGVVEVDEDKRRWIYKDDPDGVRKLRERERAARRKEEKASQEGGESFAGVDRYAMVSKRIW